MTRFRSIAAALIVAAGAAGCAGRAPETAPAPESGPASTAPASRPQPPGGLPHTEADTRFISDMILHHAQALLISSWAATHDASPEIQRLAERIIVGQNDETELMVRWLRDRGEPVPVVDTSRAAMAGTGHAGADHADHHARMPGMLTAEELAELDAARGVEFDRLFLRYMIRHHQGALTMVDQLFATPGAAQDEGVFRLASDVYADQSSEIKRMQTMLLMLPASRGD